MHTRRLILFALLLAVSAYATANYDIVVADNGNAFVSAEFTGNGTISVQIPPDAKPQVDNALFVKTADGINVSVKPGTAANVYFTTAEYTGKNGTAWKFSMPIADGDGVMMVSLPENATLISSFPQNGVQMQANGSLQITWIYNSPVQALTLSYSTEPPAAAPPVNVTANGSATQGGANEPFTLQEWVQDFMASLLGIIVIGAIAAGAYFLFIRKMGVQPSSPNQVEAPAAPLAPSPPAVPAFPPSQVQTEALAQSEGMKKVTAVLGENDSAIVYLLLGSGGELKRSLIEKRLGLPKSSLALSLRRLRGKNVVDIDETGFTQRVRLSEWFRGL